MFFSKTNHVFIFLYQFLFLSQTLFMFLNFLYIDIKKFLKSYKTVYKSFL